MSESQYSFTYFRTHYPFTGNKLRNELEKIPLPILQAIVTRNTESNSNTYLAYYVWDYMDKKFLTFPYKRNFTYHQNDLLKKIGPGINTDTWRFGLSHWIGIPPFNDGVRFAMLDPKKRPYESYFIFVADNSIPSILNVFSHVEPNYEEFRNLELELPPKNPIIKNVDDFIDAVKTLYQNSQSVMKLGPINSSHTLDTIFAKYRPVGYIAAFEFALPVHEFILTGKALINAINKLPLWLLQMIVAKRQDPSSNLIACWNRVLNWWSEPKLVASLIQVPGYRIRDPSYIPQIEQIIQDYGFVISQDFLFFKSPTLSPNMFSQIFDRRQQLKQHESLPENVYLPNDKVRLTNSSQFFNVLVRRMGVVDLNIFELGGKDFNEEVPYSPLPVTVKGPLERDWPFTRDLEPIPTPKLKILSPPKTKVESPIKPVIIEKAIPPTILSSPKIIPSDSLKSPIRKPFSVTNMLLSPQDIIAIADRSLPPRSKGVREIKSIEEIAARLPQVEKDQDGEYVYKKTGNKVPGKGELGELLSTTSGRLQIARKIHAKRVATRELETKNSRYQELKRELQQIKRDEYEKKGISVGKSSTETGRGKAIRIKAEERFISIASKNPATLTEKERRILSSFRSRARKRLGKKQ